MTQWKHRVGLAKDGFGWIEVLKTFLESIGVDQIAFKR